MVNKTYRIVWTRRSQTHLAAAHKFIAQDSKKQADKVVANIASAVYKAIENPEYYNPDKFKVDNDGSYRAFEKHHFRISYRFTATVIRVLRVRHTKMSINKY